MTTEQESRPERLNLQLEFCWANWREANLQYSRMNFDKKECIRKDFDSVIRTLNQDRHFRKNYTAWDKKQGTQTSCGLSASEIKSFHHFFNKSIFKKLRSWNPVPSLHGKQMGNNANSDRLNFLGLQKSLQIVTAAMKLKDACSLEEKLWPT